jgi:hypothetical protein
MRDLSAAKAALTKQQIELPSWAFGNTGTRFKVFGQPGVPRTPWEKAEDAAQVHRYAGVAPSMAVHIPWDRVDDYGALARHAAGLGIRIGTVNANVFQDDDYKLGSVCHPDPRVRKKAVAHLLDCVDVMDATGSRDLKLWFADGTNYPGQDLRTRVNQAGFYLMDEPDAPLSFTGCLGLAALLHDLAEAGSQLVVATHSPVLAAIPGAALLELGPWGIRPATWEDLGLVVAWRQFMNDPPSFFRHLFPAG